MRKIYLITFIVLLVQINCVLGDDTVPDGDFFEEDLMIEEEELMINDDSDLYEDDDEPMEGEAQVEPEEVIPEPEYSIIEQVQGSYLFENFQHGLGKWTHSSSNDFPGRFEIGNSVDNPHLEVETGLYVPQEARRYAVYGALDEVFNFGEQQTFVVQYEVRLHAGLQCGGAYIKLLSDREGFKPADVTNETPYTVMFGPDKCGGTDKVHFIWKFKNPKSGEYVEHHLKNPPSTVGTSDRRSHVYTLVIRSDNTFEMFVDRDSKAKGSLLDAFDPPLNPPKEIDDPDDEKPDEWVDEPRIPDPLATKPDDWDEEAPKTIVDPDDEMPEDWLEDEPLEIPDPNTYAPDDLDEDEDGEWEAPIVDNPKCEEVSGCGEWEPEMIDNPDYKGTWYAPMIDNPKYVGEWTPRKIPNPNFSKKQILF
eukprot:UN34301